MNKILKLLFSVSLILIYDYGQCQNDTVIKKNKSVWIGTGFGIPVINTFIVANGFNLKEHYKVKSKSKIQVSLSLEKQYKHFFLGVSTALIQNEFIGRSFDVEIPTYSKFPPYFSAIYKVHQRINYNYFHLGINIGGLFNIGQKHKILIGPELFFTYKYDIRITNYYDAEQYGYDTTQYRLAKNVRSVKHYGYFIPKVGLNFRYFYRISDRLSFDLAIQVYYSFLSTIQGSGDDYYGVFEKGQFAMTYNYLNVYDELNHFMLSPILSIKYRLTN